MNRVRTTDLIICFDESGKQSSVNNPITPGTKRKAKITLTLKLLKENKLQPFLEESSFIPIKEFKSVKRGKC
ncbi:hypothetical protein [Sporosarcina sp. UB5]|uniref:hypothetical protein n=1 Tax=Sporosarcina sp. UB5 TaxID=3047463 RepID=UPI003D79FDDF